MEITKFFSNLNLQSIRNGLDYAYNSSSIAKLKALSYGLIGYAIFKSAKMAFTAYKYPKGWDLSSDEHEAVAEFVSSSKTFQNNIEILFRQQSKDPSLQANTDLTEVRQAKEQILKSRAELKKIIDKNMENANRTVDLPAAIKLYNRTAQLLPWPEYIKSLW